MFIIQNIKNQKNVLKETEVQIPLPSQHFAL
jgi:hypothetical protein